jgi:hypothetical protein
VPVVFSLLLCATSKITSSLKISKSNQQRNTQYKYSMWKDCTTAIILALTLTLTTVYLGACRCPAMLESKFLTVFGMSLWL